MQLFPNNYELVSKTPAVSTKRLFKIQYEIHFNLSSFDVIHIGSYSSFKFHSIALHYWRSDLC